MAETTEGREVTIEQATIVIPPEAIEDAEQAGYKRAQATLRIRVPGLPLVVAVPLEIAWDATPADEEDDGTAPDA